MAVDVISDNTFFVSFAFTGTHDYDQFRDIKETDACEKEIVFHNIPSRGQKHHLVVKFFTKFEAWRSW